jgi:hypothetical protein
VGKWYKTSGEGDLCWEGWLHFYHSPDLAVLLNPIHADFKDPVLWEAECRGKSLDDRGLKIGWTEARIVKKIKLPKWTTTQKVAFGILCAKEVFFDNVWNRWADDWISGKDRSENAAMVADAAAVDAARAAVANASVAKWAAVANAANAEVAEAARAAARAAWWSAEAASAKLDFPKIILEAKKVK